jgi:hypothetical protein
MYNFQVIKTPQFKYDYAIINDSLKQAADDAIALIAENPQAGEIKKSEISEEGEHVYTFRHGEHLMLLSYKYDPTTRVLVSLVVRQDFFKKK